MENYKTLKIPACEKEVLDQPPSQSCSAISDVTSSFKLVGKIRFQASSGNSDSVNWPGYEAGSKPFIT